MVDTSMYAAAVGAPKSYQDYLAENQSIQQNALALQQGRQKLDAYTQDQAEKTSLRNLLSGQTLDLSNPADQAKLYTAAPTLAPGLLKTHQEGLTSAAKAQLDASQAGHYDAETAQKTYDLTRQKLDRSIQMVSQSPSPDIARQHVAQLVQDGLMTPQDGQRKLQEIPDDPQAYQQWRLGSMASLMNAHDQFEANKPTMGTRNTGNTVQNTATNPMTGQVAVTATTPLQATPGEVLQASTSRANNRDTIAAENGRAQGQVTYQTDANGNMVALPVRAVAGAPITAQPVTSNGAPLPGQSKMTESQGKATTFAARMQDSESIIQRLEKNGVSGSDFSTLAAGNGWTNFLASPEGQDYRQAQENWVTANLRQESGAAIGKDEMAKDVRKFFPTPGDSQSVKDQKTRARAIATQGMLQQAGPGASQVPRILQQAGAAPVPAALSGFKITHVDGKAQ